MFWLYIYVGIIVLALVTEFLTSEMVSIWFCGGAIVAIPLVLFGLDWFIHFPVFVVVAVALILCFRKIVLKFLDKGETLTNAGAVIGKEFELITEIAFNTPGTIRVNDVVWNVVTENCKDVIPVGKIVKVKNIKGNKYIVEVVE